MEPGDPLPRPSRLSQLVCSLPPFTHNASRWDGADRQSSSGSPSPLHSPVACPMATHGTQPSTTAGNERAPELSRSTSAARAPFMENLLKKRIQHDK
jgi:hypothetical protein